MSLANVGVDGEIVVGVMRWTGHAAVLAVGRVFIIFVAWADRARIGVARAVLMAGAVPVADLIVGRWRWMAARE